MPAQTAQRKAPTAAEMRHKEIMADKNIVATRLSMQAASHQHKIDQDSRAHDEKMAAHELKMQKAEQSHELTMTQLDPEVDLMLRQRNLEGMSHAEIKKHATTASSGLLKVITDVGDRIKKHYDEVARTKVRADAVNTDVSKAKPGTGKKPKVDFDTDITKKSQEAIQSLADRGGRLRSPRNRFSGRTSVKKKLTESQLINTPPSEIWLMGSFTPFSAHHVTAAREIRDLYANHPVTEHLPFKIGITGKERPDDYTLPTIPKTVTSESDYIAHVKKDFMPFLRVNTPISLKMAVARAVAPDLRDNFVWVKDALGTPPTDLHKPPAPGAVIHNDGFAAYAEKLPKGFVRTDKYPMPQQEITGYYFGSPNLVMDHTGKNKISTGPVRESLMDAHVNLKEGNFNSNTKAALERTINETHANLLGVPVDSEAVKHSKTMSDWHADSWISVRDAAKKAYQEHNSIRENLEESRTRFEHITGKVRDAAIASLSQALTNHLQAAKNGNNDFDRRAEFHNIASQEIESYDDPAVRSELDRFFDMCRAAPIGNVRVNAELPFNPRSNIDNVLQRMGGVRRNPPPQQQIIKTTNPTTLRYRMGGSKTVEEAREAFSSVDYNSFEKYFKHLTGDKRQAALSALSQAMLDHLNAPDRDNFNRRASFMQYAQQSIPNHDDPRIGRELDIFYQMAHRLPIGNMKFNKFLPFIPTADIDEVVHRDNLKEDHRHAAGTGERLLRAQSLQSVGKRIGARPSPPTNQNVLLRRAKRAARYDLRKKLAPNYHNMSTGQKQDIDERIAKHAEFKQLVDKHYAEYKKKATKHAYSSSHNKKAKS